MAEIGSTLRSARLQRGLTIEQAAQDTRISARFLEALEEDDFGALPAAVYVRGFLRSYASYLRLDATPLLASLEGDARMPGAPDAYVRGPSRPAPGAPGQSRDPWRSAPRPVPPPPAQEPVVPGPEIMDDGDPGGLSSAALYADEDFPEEDYADDGEDGGETRFQGHAVAGVLAERERQQADRRGGGRLAALVAGVILVAIGGAVAVYAFAAGGDDGDGDQATAPGDTPTAAARTVITVGSATARPSAAASPTGAASATASPAGTPGATVTATAAAGTPGTSPSPTATATRAAAATNPTATPTDTPSPTPTTAPTATPLPPTPTPSPTPLPVAPATFAECTPTGPNSYDCGSFPLRVVCHPGGYFVDVGRNFLVPVAPGWRTAEAAGPTLGSVITIGTARCE